MPTVIIVAGPTAVGKTAFAIEIAKRLGTSIISADSRQCYRELNIGVARPSEAELSTVPHYFIASHSVIENLNAGSFERYALGKTAQLFQDRPVVVMVGGTGLYIKAFCEGIDPIPEVPEEIRQQVTEGYRQNGLIWLQKELEHKDPAFWEVAERQNPQRLMRALEVLYATGESIMKYRVRSKVERPFNIIKLALELPKEELRSNIDTRVDAMMDAGLLNEIRQLLPYRSYNALQTVGYRELFSYLDGDCTLDEAIAAIKTNTRQYAKRQMTWFKKEPDWQWMHPGLSNVATVLEQLRD